MATGAHNTWRGGRHNVFGHEHRFAVPLVTVAQGGEDVEFVGGTDVEFLLDESAYAFLQV